MPIPGVHIETIRPPQDYHPSQIETACAVAQQLHRGTFVLAEEPKR